MSDIPKASRFISKTSKAAEQLLVKTNVVLRYRRVRKSEKEIDKNEGCWHKFLVFFPPL